MESNGGGWTVLQRREDGSVDFHRTWKEYKIVSNVFGGINIGYYNLKFADKVIQIASLEHKQVLKAVFILTCSFLKCQSSKSALTNNLYKCDVCL